MLLISLLGLASSGCYGQQAGTYTIQSVKSGLYLDVQWGKSDDGTPLHQWSYNGQKPQQFTLEDAGGGYFHIKSGIGGKYVHVQNVSSKPEAAAHLWTGKGHDGTKWKFIKVAGGNYLIQSKLGTFLDVKWASTEPGALVWLWTKHGRENQQWQLKPIGENSGSGGASGAVMTRFSPERHGFNFTNRFDNWGTHFGQEINFSGLCGGMSYASLDYYYAGVAVPIATSTPTEGNQLTNFIRGRQWKSYDNQGDKWAELFINPFGWRTSEFFNWGIQGYNGGRLEELRARIDAGQPVPLGLFAAGSGGLTSKHHQVVAIGYKLNGYDGRFGTNANKLEIYVYDPNCPNSIRTLMPNTQASNYYYKEEPQKKWLTYFVDMRYSKVRPLDPAASQRCSEKNFTNANKSGQNLSRQSFRCLKGNYMNARGATIHGSDFYEGQLQDAVFYGADCQGSSFESVKAYKANYEGANLYNTVFIRADVHNARFYGADMRLVKGSYASFDNSNMEGANLYQGIFELASFRGARLYGTSLNSAKLSGADFTGANLDGADLRGANLSNANFKDAKITQHTRVDANVQGQVRNWPGIRPR